MNDQQKKNLMYDHFWLGTTYALLTIWSATIIFGLWAYAPGPSSDIFSDWVPKPLVGLASIWLIGSCILVPLILIGLYIDRVNKPEVHPLEKESDETPQPQ